jgi:predicted ester cyclase
MSTEDNKALVSRFYEEILNGGNLALADNLLAADYKEDNVPSGPEGFRQFVARVGGAFPDLHITVEDMVAEGDKVVAQLTVTGTQLGPLSGPMGHIAPTGKRATWRGIDIFRVAGGKIAERRGIRDFLGMVQQLGAIPMQQKD